MKRNKKPNKRIKITIKSKEGRKKLDKKNFWLSLVTLLFVLISLQILFFATGRKDQKGIYDVQAGALCGQGTYQYNGCTACDMPPGWTYCGGGLTYECGTVCLHPSCGAAACSGPTQYTVTYTKNIAAAGTLNPTSRVVNSGSSAAGPTVSTNTGYVFVNFSIVSGSCAGTFTASTGTCSNVQQNMTIQANWTINQYLVTISNGGGGTCSPGTHSVAHAGTSSAQSCVRSGYVLSSFSQTGCGGTFNSSTGVCSSVTQAMTITANWTINQYLVTISNGGGGTCTGSTTNVPYGSPSPTPGCSNRVGYILSGYSLSSGTCGGTFNTSTGVCSSVTGPITVVANWSPAQENPITSWFSSSWLYRSPIYVSGSGTVVSNAEVLVIVNTASLISSNKMQSTCNDMRFVDSNDTTAISFWIEGGCNTTTTRVWVRIPSLPTTGKTIYMYYGNPSASNAELPWTGGFIVLSTSACPTGWTRDANFDSRFPLSHESYGSKAGNSTHGHTVPSFTLTGNDAPAFMDTWGGATDYSSKTGHTHTVTISVSNASTLPPYTTMLFCKANDLNLFSGSVVMDKTGSVGNYYSALNDRFPYGSTSSGTQGGSNTHTHSIPQTTSTAASLNGSSITHPGSGPDPGALVATVTHTHIVSAATTNAASNLPPYYSLRYITLTTYGNIPSIITMGDSVPPLGWSRLTNFDSRLPYGSSNIGSTGGSASHNHTGSVTIQGVSNRVWRYEGGHGGGSYSAQQHTHQGTVSYTTSTYNSYPPYMSTLFIERKTSTSTSLQPEQKYNAAPSAPLNLVATYGDGQVTLGWNKPSDEGGEVTDYIVQYSNDGGSTWSTFNDGVSPNRYATVTGLTNGNLYTFRVAAVNPTGTSPYSNTVQSTPQALSITSISPTSGSILGGGSMTINATGLGDSQKFVQISSGNSHTCGISYDGQGYCWGLNNSGQLGNGDTINSTGPVLISQGARDPGVTFISISAGVNHTCAIGSDGEGYCWGYGGSGRLGNGGTGNSNIPVLVSQGARDPGVTFVSISAGQYHTCAIGSDGEGYCWGSGSSGRLGNGGTGDSNIPVLVSQGARDPGVTFVSISAGNQHTCAIGSDGEGYCWGSGSSGRLGNGGTGDSNIPVLVSQGARDPGVTFVSISAGQYHTCAIGSDGEGYCWGYNNYGRLGNGGTGDSSIPVLVSQGARDPGVTFSSISAGNNHTCGLGSDGEGYCWGYGGSGRLGNGGTGNSNIPVLVSQGARNPGVTFVSIGAGGNHTCAIGSDSQGYCWGFGSSGQLGDGGTTSSTTPVLVGPYEYQITIGSNTLTQVIPAGSTSITVAQIPAHAVGVVSVSLTRIVDNTTSNSVSYTYTNLSSPDITGITPSTVSPNTSNTFSLTGTNFLDYGPISNLTSVSAGNSHTCGLDSDGEGYCWGRNNYGQLGNGYNGSGTDSNVSVLVSQGARDPGVTFSNISAGQYHTCAIGSDGEGYCWGYNNYGQLGNGSSGSGTNSNIPVLVSRGARNPGVTFSSISAGGYHTCGLGSDGNGYCWGYNYYGQLGNGNTGTDSNVPVLVSQGARDPGVTFISISAGSSHTCAIGSDGEGYCWGLGTYGQLGNGGTSQSPTPVLVSRGARDPGVTFISISAGSSHTCAIGSDGEGYCWGLGTYGQLGNGGTSQSPTPVLVSRGARDPGVTFISISAGSSHTCAIGSDGEGYCWGDGSYGRLGNGGTAQSITPVLVNPGAVASEVTFTNISVGISHTCGRLSNNRTLCWGNNQYGQLGNRETVDRLTPSYVIIIKSPTIEFGSTPATSTTYTSTTAMSAVSPVLSVGTVAVKLTNPDGQYDTYDILVQSPPTVPLNLGATAGNTQVVLTWNVPSSDGGSSITDYIIQYSTDNSTWTTFNDGTSTNTTATVTGLTNRTLYYFRVAAVNNIGTGPYTSSVTATPVNPLPTVTNVTLNGGNAITLVEGNTKSVTLTAQVINDTGCTEITSVKGYLYRSGKGYTNCNNSEDADGNFCYPEIGCSVDTGSCTGSTDYTADYTCTVSVQYFADPTDTGTLYDSENWLATIKATNSGDLSTSTEVTTGVEMNSLTAFSVTSTLSYSDLLVGESNNPLDRVLTTTATGNVGLDQEHKGEGIGMCTDYPTCEVGTPIALSHQKYSLTASTPYSTPTTAISLTNTSVEVELNLAKPTSTTAVSKNTWWGVFIPPGTLPGYYQGRNTITAVKGETTHW